MEQDLTHNHLEEQGVDPRMCEPWNPDSKIAEKEPVCTRCGRCCHFWADNKLHKCKHLIKLSKETSLCRIYKHRLGALLYENKRTGIKVHCGTRGSLKANFKGCPYNVEGQPTINVRY